MTATRWMGAWLAIAALACAPFPPNPPLERYDPKYGHRVSTTSGDADDSRELLLVVTFSGGGMRAAAFAYGVLQALAETKVRFDGRERALVDEIDVLSSVSAGSFTAAYFALHGRRIFDDFERRFLSRNVERGLLWRTLAPHAWPRLVSSHVGRSDLAAEYYDALLFDGATLGDLAGGGRPALMINATDMTLAARFAFDQEHFDLLCSDSLAFPIARAVAASSAVPGLFSPVTLTNYAARGCGYQPPEWVEQELARGYASTRRNEEARRIAGYRVESGDAYVHLLDGALADNLGLRHSIEAAVTAGGYAALAEQSGFTRFRRVAYLVVNAQTKSRPDWTRSAAAPSTLSTLVSASTVAVNRYNFETLELFRGNLERYMRELRAVRCRPRDGTRPPADCGDVASHFVEIAFAQHPDPAERAYLAELPTSLALDEPDRARTIAAAHRILATSPEFQALLADLAKLPPRAGP